VVVGGGGGAVVVVVGGTVVVVVGSGGRMARWSAIGAIAGVSEDGSGSPPWVSPVVAETTTRPPASSDGSSSGLRMGRTPYELVAKIAIP
jgi:hypothetical protein